MSGQEDASNSSELSDDYDKLNFKDSIKNRIESFDRVATIDAVIAAPGKFKRELSSMSATSILTRFPLITVLGCVLLTFVVFTDFGLLKLLFTKTIVYEIWYFSNYIYKNLFCH